MAPTSHKIAKRNVKEFLESKGNKDQLLRKEARVLIKIALNNVRPRSTSDSFNQILTSNSDLEYPTKAGHNIHFELLKDERFQDCVSKEIKEICEDLGKKYDYREIENRASVGEILLDVLGPNYIIYKKSDFTNRSPRNAKVSQIKTFEESLKSILEPISYYFDLKFNLEEVRGNKKLIKVDIAVGEVSESYKISKHVGNHRSTINAANRILNRLESDKIYFVGTEDKFKKEIFFLEKDKMRAFIDYFEQPEEVFAPESNIKIRKSD